MLKHLPTSARKSAQNADCRRRWLVTGSLPVTLTLMLTICGLTATVAYGYKKLVEVPMISYPTPVYQHKVQAAQHWQQMASDMAAMVPLDIEYRAEEIMLAEQAEKALLDAQKQETQEEAAKNRKRREITEEKDEVKIEAPLPDAALYIAPPVPEKATPFAQAYHQFLVNALRNKGIEISLSPDGNPVMQVEVQHIDHGDRHKGMTDRYPRVYYEAPSKEPEIGEKGVIEPRAGRTSKWHLARHEVLVSARISYSDALLFYQTQLVYINARETELYVPSPEPPPLHTIQVTDSR